MEKTLGGTLEPSCLCASISRDGSLLFPRQRRGEILPLLAGLNHSFASITQEGTRLFDAAASRLHAIVYPIRPPGAPYCSMRSRLRRKNGGSLYLAESAFHSPAPHPCEGLRDASLRWCACGLQGTIFAFARAMYTCTRDSNHGHASKSRSPRNHSPFLSHHCLRMGIIVRFCHLFPPPSISSSYDPSIEHGMSVVGT